MKIINVITVVLKLLISGSLLLYLFYFSGSVDYHGVLETLKKTHLFLFILVFFIALCTVFIATKRWSLFLPDITKYSRLVSLVFIGYFFNTFLPGRIGGEVIRTFYIYRDIDKAGISIASVFMDKYMGFSAMVGISLAAFMAGYSNFKGTEIEWLIPGSCSIFIVASFIFWRINWGKIKSLRTFYQHILVYKTNRRVMCIGLLLSLIIQVVNIMEVYLLSLALGFTVPIIYFFIFVPVIGVLSAIPITIAGLGLREVGFAALFGMFFTELGVTADQAVSLSMLCFVIMTLVNLIGGVEYLRIRKLY